MTEDDLGLSSLGRGQSSGSFGALLGRGNADDGWRCGDGALSDHDLGGGLGRRESGGFGGALGGTLVEKGLSDVELDDALDGLDRGW